MNREYCFLILTIVIAIFAGITALVWKPMSAFATEPERLLALLRNAGSWSAVVFGILSIIQVVCAVCYFLGLRLYKHWNKEEHS